MTADLPPGFQVALVPADTCDTTRYVIEGDGQPTRSRDQVVAEAWADVRRRLVEQHLRSAAPVDLTLTTLGLDDGAPVTLVFQQV